LWRRHAVDFRAHAQDVERSQDIGLICAVLLPRAAVCNTCIARKAGLTRSRTDRALMQISPAEIVSTVARCDACLLPAVVHQLG
jgi:hypothetical protein